MVAVKEIEKLTGIEISNKSELVRFDFSFVPSAVVPINQNLYNENRVVYEESEEEDDDDDDMPGYDIDELL